MFNVRSLFRSFSAAGWCPCRSRPVHEGAATFTPIAELLSDAPHAPWIYTGAIENYPKLLAQLPSRACPLWGNSAEVVRLARDPAVWLPLLQTAGISVPTNTANAEELPHDGTWLMKPRRSAG